MNIEYCVLYKRKNSSAQAIRCGETRILDIAKFWHEHLTKAGHDAWIEQREVGEWELFDEEIDSEA